ncbi:hypothetical protein LJB99_03825 [Deltaproteobacteria bacterium OttesenSCG-928-K17]|nr:hypothetical protein [Deltaproteobacteria bacterium OttesenSCG-928-K17]
MLDLKVLRERLSEALAHPDLPENGVKRLILMVLSLLAAKAVLRMVLTVLLIVIVAAWFTSRYDADNSGALRKAEEASQAIEQAEIRADSLQRKNLIAQQEETIQEAVKAVALAMLARNTEYMATGRPGEHGITTNVDDLYDYGFRRHPDLIYDIAVTAFDNGNPTFVVTVSHNKPGPRAFKWDLNKGSGVEPVETAPGSAPSPPASATDKPRAALNDAQAIQDKEFDITFALQQLTFAQLKHLEATGHFTADYNALHTYYPWKGDARLIYEEIKLDHTDEGGPDFEVIVRHKDRGPRAFKYKHSAERKLCPVE